MTDLTEAEIHALTEALDDEYKAWATYDQVIADFGEVAPLRHIRETEVRHIAALRPLDLAAGEVAGGVAFNQWSTPCRIRRPAVTFTRSLARNQARA